MASRDLSLAAPRGAFRLPPSGMSVPQVARRLVTTRTALVLGFGVLLILLMLSGFNAVHVLSQLQSSNEIAHREYLATARQLDELRAAVYLSGTYVRDYLLEADPARAEQSRSALEGAQRQIVSVLGARGAAAGQRDRKLYESLQQQVREYWRAVEPVLGWSPDRRRREGYGFLRDQVLPRRSSTLTIADTIAAMNQKELVRQDQRLTDMFSGLRNRTFLLVGLMVLLGFVQASASTIHILRLERRTLGHLAEVAEARQELKGLSAKLVDTQESERRNISRELHDAVGQSISVVQLELYDLAAALAPYPAPLRTRVDRIRELVESSLAMVRNVALLLRPSMLDDLGLEAAIEWQAHQVARSTGLRIEVTAEDLPESLPDEQRTCIFRLVQEALNNICRHANANRVAISLRAEGESITLAVSDDGRGFRPARARGLGLVGMQERVDALGGRLRIQSEPGKGTAVEACLPLPHNR